MLFHKKPKKKTYDSNRYRPILRVSICTGETVAGFKERTTNRFTEVMLIRNAEDLREFKETYDIEEIEKEY